jgi:hypothetical protein
VRTPRQPGTRATPALVVGRRDSRPSSRDEVPAGKHFGTRGTSCIPSPHRATRLPCPRRMSAGTSSGRGLRSSPRSATPSSSSPHTWRSSGSITGPSRRRPSTTTSMPRWTSRRMAVPLRQRKSTDSPRSGGDGAGSRAERSAAGGRVSTGGILASAAVRGARSCYCDSALSGPMFDGVGIVLVLGFCRMRCCRQHVVGGSTYLVLCVLVLCPAARRAGARLPGGAPGGWLSCSTLAGLQLCNTASSFARSETPQKITSIIQCYTRRQ